MNNLEHFVPAINTLILISLVAFVITRAKYWTGPVQSQRIGAIEDDLRIVRGNMLRLERDQSLAHREYMNSNAEILKEVRSITVSGALHPICDELKIIESRIEMVEKDLASMPCSEHIKNGKIVFEGEE